MSDRIKIMVVDDEKEITTILAEYFSAEGFAVREFTKPQQALEAIRSYQPNVIFLDIIMPVINGYEFCQNVKENTRLTDTPVIFLSAKDHADNQDAFSSCGADLFLQKPFDLPDLKQVAIMASNGQLPQYELLSHEPAKKE